jgi:hypothetical protein
MELKPTPSQSQGLYRLSYRLTNIIYPGWSCRNIELVRMDERTGNLYVFATSQETDMGMDFEIKPSGGYEP